MNIRLDSDRLDSPAAGPLVAALMAEMQARYAAEGAGKWSDAREFVPPGADFVVAWEGVEAVGCGGFRTWADGVAEIKRMYVRPSHRGRGISKLLLAELEGRAARAGFGQVRLETGTAQPEAIGLYERAGYARIPPYGEFRESPSSVCFEKILTGMSGSLHNSCANLA